MLAAILVYAAVLAAAGARLGRRVRGAADFFVASRGLGAGLLFATLLAANLGAGATVGVAQLAYEHGLAAWWWVGSAGIGSLILAFSAGPRLRAIAAAHGLYTVGDYLELRYGRATRLAAAALLWLGAPAILAGQLIAMGTILEVAAGLPRAWGCAVGGAVVTAYFAAGGLWGAARINLVQVAVKAAGFLLAVPWAISGAGGLAGLAAAAPDASFLRLDGAPGPAFGWALVLIPSFVVSPGLVQKIFGARDDRAVRRGAGAQGAVLLVYSFLPVALGMAARVLFPDMADAGLALPRLLAEALPVWLGGLLLAAIFSAEISSADAVLFMLSTSVARDLGQTLLGRAADDRSLLAWARGSAVVAGAAGVAVAIRLDSIVAALTIFYTLLTVALLVPLVGGLYWRRPAQSAALGAMAAGCAAALAWAPWAGVLASTSAFLLFSVRNRPPARPVEEPSS